MTTLYLTLGVYAALAIACGIAVWLYLCAQREVRSLRTGAATSAGAPLMKLRSRARDLSRQGVTTANIAGRLDLPLAEVELIIEAENRAAQRTTTLATA